MLHAIGSAMTKNVPEADPKYAEVAVEYEEEVLVVGVPEAFTNFLLFQFLPMASPTT